MSVKVKKKALVLLAACILQSVLHADSPSLDVRVKEIEERLNAITSINALGFESSENASACPSVIGKDWFGYVDLLLWKAKVAGTEFAYSNDQYSVDQPIQGRSKECKFDWNWGFRVGAGRNFQHDAWSASLDFTYFKSSGNAKLTGGTTSAVIPLRGPFAQTVHIAKSSIKNTLYNVDANLYRHYFISASLSLKPTIGLKNSWISLKQIVWYNDGENLGYNTAQTIDKNKMWGIGPKVGIDSTWYLKNNLHVFGLFSGSLLYSYFDVYQDSNLTPSDNLDFYMMEQKHRFIPTLQLSLGLGYSTYLREKQNFLVVRLGYETCYYYRANQTLSLQEFNNTFRFTNVSDDISMYGVTLSAKLYF